LIKVNDAGMSRLSGQSVALQQLFRTEPRLANPRNHTALIIINRIKDRWNHTFVINAARAFQGSTP